MFRFSLRELMWLTLVVGLAVGWWMESYRTRQWQQRAELAAGQLEIENLGRMVFENDGVTYHSNTVVPQSPYRDVFYRTNRLP